MTIIYSSEYLATFGNIDSNVNEIMTENKHIREKLKNNLLRFGEESFSVFLEDIIGISSKYKFSGKTLDTFFAEEFRGKNLMARPVDLPNNMAHP